MGDWTCGLLRACGARACSYLEDQREVGVEALLRSHQSSQRLSEKQLETMLLRRNLEYTLQYLKDGTVHSDSVLVTCVESAADRTVFSMTKADQEFESDYEYVVTGGPGYDPRSVTNAIAIGSNVYAESNTAVIGNDATQRTILRGEMQVGGSNTLQLGSTTITEDQLKKIVLSIGRGPAEFWVSGEHAVDNAFNGQYLKLDEQVNDHDAWKLQDKEM